MELRVESLCVMGKSQEGGTNMEIIIGVKIKSSDTESYDMSLAIPTDISEENPFNFEVNQITKPAEADAKENAEPTSEKVLQVAFVNGDNVYTYLKPPTSLMESTGAKDVIELLQVEVTEGQYDKDKEKFVTKDTES